MTQKLANISVSPTQRIEKVTRKRLVGPNKIFYSLVMPGSPGDFLQIENSVWRRLRTGVNILYWFEEKGTPTRTWGQLRPVEFKDNSKYDRKYP